MPTSAAARICSRTCSPGVPRCAERERLQVGPDARGAVEQRAPPQPILQRPPHHQVRLRVRGLGAVHPGRVMARIHHRQHDVRRRHQVFPHLPDPHVAGHDRRHPEDVERHRHAVRAHPAPEQGQVALHPLAGGLAGAARGEHRRRHPGAGLVREAHVVELHLRKPHLDRLGRELRGVHPHRIVEGVHPGGAAAVAPESAGAALDGPFGLPLREQRVLGHHDPCDRVDAVRQHLADAGLGVPRPQFLRGADRDRGGHRGGVGEEAGVVLDVDDQRVHLGFVRQPDQFAEPASAECPGVDVEGAHLVGGPHQRRARPGGVQVGRQGGKGGEEVDAVGLRQLAVPPPLLGEQGSAENGTDREDDAHA